MNTNYGIDVTKYPEYDVKVINNEHCEKNFSFVNDYKIRPKSMMAKRTIIKSEDENDNKDITKDPLNILDDETLKTLEYYKGMLIKNCKVYDLNRSGRISKAETINAIVQTNINNKVDYNTAKAIVEGYYQTEDIEYMKFIALLVKNSKIILLKKNNNNNNGKNINYNALKRENFFSATKRQNFTGFHSTKNSQNRLGKKEVLIQIYLKAINLTKHLYHLQKKKKIVKIINLFKMQIPVLVLVLIQKMPEIIY